MATFRVDIEDKAKRTLDKIDQAIKVVQEAAEAAKENTMETKQITPIPWYQSSPESRANMRVTVPIAFEIIVHHFSGGKTFLSKQDIDNRVLDAHEAQNGIPEFDETDPVNTVLYALKRFGFAEHQGRDQWRIKSVDDMCARLHALVRNRNIGDEGEDF